MFETSLDAILPSEGRAARVAARADLITELSITVHTETGTKGLQKLDLFVSEGASPERVIIKHVDWNLDKRCLRQLLDRGA